MNDSTVQGHRVPIRMYRVLVEASVSMRLNCMSEEHRILMDRRVDEIEVSDDYANETSDDVHYDERGVLGHYNEIRDLVTNYSHLHRELLRDAAIFLSLRMRDPQVDVIKHVWAFL